MTATPAHAPTVPTHLWLTDEEEACRLLAEDPAALVIGFILDQQVTVQKAFRGPWDLRQRVGTIDPRRLAEMTVEELEQAFRDKPALHRFPAANARRVREAMRIIVDRYEGDAGRIWSDAPDLSELERRLDEIPGFATHKITSMVAVLARRFGVPVTGWEDRIPEWGTLGDVGSPEDLRAYQARKRAVKAARRTAAEAASADPAT